MTLRTAGAALDLRRRAFAQALGRAIAESVWRDVQQQHAAHDTEQDSLNAAPEAWVMNEQRPGGRLEGTRRR